MLMGIYTSSLSTFLLVGIIGTSAPLVGRPTLESHGRV